MLKLVDNNEEYMIAARLFHEYAVWLNIDLSFQNFERELHEMPQMYGSPHGCIFLYTDNEIHVACVAVRRIEDKIAELKRMYVKETYRKKGVGQQLLDAALDFAVAAGYEAIRLDTLASMTPAMQLYKKNGFREIQAYYHNPHDNAVYFEKKLTKA